MVSVSPSPALLNAQLTARNIELEAELQAKGRENPMLRDRVEQFEELAAESRQQLATLQAHIKRLLDGRGLPMIGEGQALLFDAAAASAVGTLEDSIAPDPQEIVELGHEDAGVPDAEEAPKKTKARRDRRKYDESNLKRELRRSELPEDQRQCPETGVQLVEIATKVTTQLDEGGAGNRSNGQEAEHQEGSQTVQDS